MKTVFLSVVVQGSKAHLAVVSSLFHADEWGKESEGEASDSSFGQKGAYRASPTFDWQRLPMWLLLYIKETGRHSPLSRSYFSVTQVLRDSQLFLP